MTNVKPHFECSGYGCNDCTKGVIIEEPEIKDKPEMPVLYFKGTQYFLRDLPIVIHGAKRGYFVEIEE